MPGKYCLRLFPNIFEILLDFGHYITAYYRYLVSFQNAYGSADDQ
jgi:hypothetical protein